MKCVKCSNKMVFQVVKDDFGYHVCVKCFGRWIDGYTLNQFCTTFWTEGKERVFKHFMELPLKNTEINCPECHSKNLTLVEVKGIEVEFCLGCHSVYFDTGEMNEAMPSGKFKIDNNGKSYELQGNPPEISKLLFEMFDF